MLAQLTLDRFFNTLEIRAFFHHSLVVRSFGTIGVDESFFREIELLFSPSRRQSSVFSQRSSHKLTRPRVSLSLELPDELAGL